MNRPIQVTVVAWIIIALSVEGLIGMIGGFITPIFTSGDLNLPYSLSTNMLTGAATLVVYIVLAALMLKGFAWAKNIYIALLFLAFVGVIISKQPLALAISTGAKFAIFGFFLLRGDSKEFFADSEQNA